MAPDTFQCNRETNVEEHFNAVAGHLQSTLEELGAEKELIDEVMAIAASTHDDVLNL